MPALDIKQNGGGDEQSAFYGAQEISKLGLFSQKFENLVKESCTEKEFQEYMTWSEENVTIPLIIKTDLIISTKCRIFRTW